MLFKKTEIYNVPKKKHCIGRHLLKSVKDDVEFTCKQHYTRSIPVDTYIWNVIAIAQSVNANCCIWKDFPKVIYSVVLHPFVFLFIQCMLCRVILIEVEIYHLVCNCLNPQTNFKASGNCQINTNFTGVIILPTQTMHCKEEVPENYDPFALFDPPKWVL